MADTRTKNIGLLLTNDEETLFEDWQKTVNGEKSDDDPSNAQIIDGAFGTVNQSISDTLTEAKKYTDEHEITYYDHPETGEVKFDVNHITSHNVSAESGVTSLTLTLPHTLKVGYISEVNFRGYVTTDNLHILQYTSDEGTETTEPTIYYVRWGSTMSEPEYSRNAFINFIFNYDGMILKCYISEVAYSGS